MAKLMQCRNGHYYDGSVYQSCPYCIPCDPDKYFDISDDDWVALPPRRESVELMLNRSAHVHCIFCMHKWEVGESRCPECGADYPEKYISFGEMPPYTRIHSGKYMIGRCLSSSESGYVYLGLDLETENKVVIKELCSQNTVDRDYNSGRITWHSLEEQSLKSHLFENEIRMLRVAEGLPYVVSLYDCFRENNTSYLVIPYVSSVHIRDVVEREDEFFNSAHWGKNLDLFRRLAEALATMHTRGIIHCDLSPDNLLLDGEGNLWAADLGSARMYTAAEMTEEKSACKPSEGVIRLTQSGGFTPPELSCGTGAIGPWTDVYSLCAVMLYFYTYREPPDAADRLEQDTIDSFFIGAPTDICEVLSRGLSLEPGARFQTMTELVDALAQISCVAPVLRYPVYTVGDDGDLEKTDGDLEKTIDTFFHYSLDDDGVTIRKYTIYGEANCIHAERILRFMPTVEGKPISAVGDGAFAGCEGLHGVFLPDTVRSIGGWAFFHCTWLEQFNMPDSVLKMGEGCFYGCSCLSDITLSHGLSEISAYSFGSCDSLTEITIPNSVRSIGDCAFCNCNSLKGVTYTGTKEQWEAISIGSGNKCLGNANIQFMG